MDSNGKKMDKYKYDDATVEVATRDMENAAGSFCPGQSRGASKALRSEHWAASGG